MLRLLFLDVVYFHSANFIHCQSYFEAKCYYEKDGIQLWKEDLVRGTSVDEEKPKEKHDEVE